MDCTYLTLTSFFSTTKTMIFIDFLIIFTCFFQDKQMKSDSRKNIDTQILAKHKKKEREAAKEGKRPFYIKKCNPSCHALFSIHKQINTY